MAEREAPTISIDLDSDVPPDEQMRSQSHKLHGVVAEAVGNVRFPIPSKEEFEGNQFLASSELEQVGKFLIDKYENDFLHLVGARIIYLWKEKGGETGGMLRYEKVDD